MLSQSPRWVGKGTIATALTWCTLAAFSPGCHPDEPQDHVEDEEGPEDSASDSAADTSDTGEAPPLVVVDCTQLPSGPKGVRLVPGASGYHGLAFDGKGYLVGSDNASLIKTASDGSWSVFSPNMGTLQQIERLPNGDLVAGSENVGGLVRVYQNGSSGFITDLAGVYGVRVGPDGMVYAANLEQVFRVDPTTRKSEVLIGRKRGFWPKVLDFSPDYSKLYIGTVSGNGKVYAVDLDTNLNPIAEPYVFATGVGGGWHDGLGVDVCGNLYVNDYYRQALFRVSPDGSVVERFLASGFAGGFYGHGLTWGSGKGGWSDHAIFLPLPYKNNQVAEVDIGVPYRDWTRGLVLNRP